MQSLARLVVSQLRSHALQGSPAGVTAAAAVAAAGGWCSIRLFSSEGMKRIYIGNLSYESTLEDVQKAFEKYGPVQDCVLPLRPDGKHKGFGFLQLDAAVADAAIQEMHQTELNGRLLNVRPAEAKPEPQPRPQWQPRSTPRREVFVRPGFTRLYIGNLNFRTTAADLGRHFQQYGAVQDCVIPLDSAGRSKGFGFVELDDEGAAAAMNALNGTEFDGRNIVVRNTVDRPQGS